MSYIFRASVSCSTIRVLYSKRVWWRKWYTHAWWEDLRTEHVNEEVKESTKRVELKQFPFHLKYMFLAEDNECPEIISANLKTSEEEKIFKRMVHWRLKRNQSNIMYVKDPHGTWTHANSTTLIKSQSYYEKLVRKKKWSCLMWGPWISVVYVVLCQRNEE